MSDPEWQEKPERGSVLGMKILFMFMKVFGTRVCRIVSFPIVTYFYLTDKETRKHSQQYLDRISEFTKKPKLSSFRHLKMFTRMVIERLNVWSGGKLPDVKWEDEEDIRALVNSNKGVVLLSAHMGNIELLRAVRTQLGKGSMNVLMDIRNAQKINSLLEESGHDDALQIIGVDESDPSLAVRLREKIDAGEAVCCMADRVMEGSKDRTRTLSFLGEDAELPEGPFILASLMKAPVYFVSCFLQKDGSYMVSFKNIFDGEVVKRSERQEHMEKMMQAFVSELEQQCVLYPYQWANFYNFWKSK
ncbi:MAG: hypothetical protein NE330_16115 [Lentisphaeraceae bacterium]|nr:hypothetical protein [Lentisphaeraceae bacterium]